MFDEEQKNRNGGWTFDPNPSHTKVRRINHRPRKDLQMCFRPRRKSLPSSYRPPLPHRVSIFGMDSESEAETIITRFGKLVILGWCRPHEKEASAL